MPGIDPWLKFLPNAREKSFQGAESGFRDSSASGDDFDRLMQSKLASTGAKPPGGIDSRSRENPLPARHPRLDPPAHTVAGKKSELEISEKKKKVADADEKVAPNPDAVPVPAQPDSSLPAFISLPLFLSGQIGGQVGAVASPEKTGNGNSAVAGALEGTSKADVLPQAGNGSQSALSATSKLAALDLSSTLEPVTAKPESKVPASDAASKNAPAAETAATGKFTSPMEAVKNPTGDSPVTAVGERAAEPATPPTAPALPDAAAAASATGKAMEAATADSAKAGADNAGTGVANMTSLMKNSQKTNKVAGLDVKVLPVLDKGGANDTNLPPTVLGRPVRAADNPGSESNFSYNGGNGQAPGTDSLTALNTLDLPTLADARMRTLDRAHDMMALHSMRLMESKSDSLSVMIKPSVGTELSLELRQRADGIEAHVKLLRGDHQLLSQHWPELQQRLELRGIRLAALSSEGDFSANDNGGFHQQQASQEEAAQRASAFAEFATANQSGGASARLTMVHEGWESWA